MRDTQRYNERDETTNNIRNLVRAPIQPTSKILWALLLIQLTTPLSQTCLPGGVTQMKADVTSDIWSFSQD